MHCMFTLILYYIRRQSRERALEFNKKMAKYWSTQSFPVTTLDWWNMTKESMTSDGLHSVSEVNLLKATHLLHAMNLIKPDLKQLTGEPQVVA